jgi:hypothetical protein
MNMAHEKKNTQVSLSVMLLHLSNQFTKMSMTNTDIGITIDETLSWQPHIDILIKKCVRQVMHCVP